MSNARDRDKAKLILLIGDVMAARRNNNQSATQNAIETLQDFRESTVFPSLGTKASAVISTIAVEDMEEGLRRLADIAEQLSPLRQSFQAGAEIADEGQASLFFPRVASTLVQVDELLNAAIAVATEFRDDIASATGDMDISKLKSLVEKVKAAGEKLGQKLEGLSE